MRLLTPPKDNFLKPDGHYLLAGLPANPAKHAVPPACWLHALDHTSVMLCLPVTVQFCVVPLLMGLSS